MGLRQQAGKTLEEISERLDRYCAVAEALRNDEELWDSLPAESRRFRDPLGILYEDAAAVAEQADMLEGESVEEYYRRIEPAILAAVQAYIDDAVEVYGVPQAYQERAERTVNGPLGVEDNS